MAFYKKVNDGNRKQSSGESWRIAKRNRPFERHQERNSQPSVCNIVFELSVSPREPSRFDKEAMAVATVRFRTAVADLGQFSIPSNPVKRKKKKLLVE